jgi:hypothetical protein
MEIDFVIYYEGKITPIEVKSSSHTRSVAFNNFVNNHKPLNAFRISTKNIGKEQDGSITYLPFYLFDTLLNNEQQIWGQ